MIVWSDLVGEAGVGTVGVVPQLGILGVVTPGVTRSTMRMRRMLRMIIIISYCLLATPGLVRVPSPANVASTVGG